MTYTQTVPLFSLSANRLLPRRLPSPESSGSREIQFADTAIRTAQGRQPVSWLGSALQRLRELADLEPGWDEAAARPIPSSLIVAVRDFLTSDPVSRLEVEPDIVPTLEGRLLIEWHTESIDLIIEAALVGNPSFYFFNNETGEEVEAPLGQRVDVIGAAFAKLAHRYQP
jgi:hypothetical protein